MSLSRLAVAVLALLAVARPASAEATAPTTEGAPYPGGPAPSGAGPAARPAPGPHATLDASLGLASGDSTGVDESQFSWGLHFTGRRGPIVLAANLEGATNVFGSLHVFATAGLGGAVELEVGRLVFTALYGVHGLEVIDFFHEGDEHDLQTLGFRAAWEGEAGSRLRGRLSAAVSGYFDLEREFDVNAGADVGGTTVIVSLGLGLGI